MAPAYQPAQCCARELAVAGQSSGSFSVTSGRQALGRRDAVAEG